MGAKACLRLLSESDSENEDWSDSGYDQMSVCVFGMYRRNIGDVACWTVLRRWKGEGGTACYLAEGNGFGRHAEEKLSLLKPSIVFVEQLLFASVENSQSEVLTNSW